TWLIYYIKFWCVNNNKIILLHFSYTVDFGYKNHICFTTCFQEKCFLYPEAHIKCSYIQRNYLAIWKPVLMIHILINRVSYNVLLANVLIASIFVNFFFL